MRSRKMFKTVIRRFYDQKVRPGLTSSLFVDRATVFGVLKQEKRNAKLTYAEIAKKLAKSEVKAMVWLWKVNPAIK